MNLEIINKQNLSQIYSPQKTDILKKMTINALGSKKSKKIQFSTLLIITGSPIRNKILFLFLRPRLRSQSINIKSFYSLRMSFFHTLTPEQSEIASLDATDTKTSLVDHYLTQLQHFDIKQQKLKWRLFFNTIPTLESTSTLYKELSSKAFLHSYSELKELQMLQYFLIAIEAPLNLQLSEKQWGLIVELMPTKKSASEYQEMSKQFLHQSAYSNPWTEQEDTMLLDIILQFQRLKKGNKWSKISKELNDRSHSLFIRTPKQCRERWGNKLDPTISRDEWKEQEDLYFLQLLLQHGRRWAELSVRLSALTENKKRTEFALKHRFKKLLQSTAPIQSKKCSFPVSSDWSQKETIKILTKIEQLERSLGSKQSFNYLPLTKQLKLDDARIVMVSGNSFQTVDISALFEKLIMAKLPSSLRNAMNE